MEIYKGGMAWIGQITTMVPIVGADRIVRAEVVCGKGGKWTGVVPKDTIIEPVIVFLPDSIVPKLVGLEFMEKMHWRVSLRKFKGCPSEVLIINIGDTFKYALEPVMGAIGEDVTRALGVLKYEKEILIDGAQIAGSFPSYIPKTDEPNFQRSEAMVDAIRGKMCIMTEKADGTSITMFYKDGFGVCSRNLELKDGQNYGWILAHRYEVDKKLNRNFAIQMEAVGPGINKNPMGLSGLECRVFSVFDIDKSMYLSYDKSNELLDMLGLSAMPKAKVIYRGLFTCQSDDEIRALAEGKYENGHAMEGVVVRPVDEIIIDGGCLSFKILNNEYER